MAQNSWCRVCLAVDVKMHWIKNTSLLEIFEKLSGTKLNAEDGRPHTLCYICYSWLQRCCRFSDMCHKSEQYQIERSLHDSEAEGELPPSGITHNLIVTAIICISITDYSNQDNTVVKAKEEVLNNEEEIEVEQEPVGIEESRLLEDATVEDNSIDLKQLPVEVNTEIHNVSALHCDVSSKTFVSKQRISRCVPNFNIKQHTGRKPYGCNVCDNTFSRRMNLQEYMRTHTGEKAFACNTCNKTFALSSTLQRHISIHTGKKPFACNMCNKTFPHSGNLQNHMRIHTREKPFACTMCNKTFAQSSYLQKHMRIHTGEKPFACNMCNKTFTCNSSLQRHIRKHTGEKPFACTMCNKTFPRKFALQRHLRIHTGEKPFACNMCNKNFTNRGNIVKHMRSHTGEKPYACNMCNKSYTYRGNLLKHMRIHTREKPIRDRIIFEDTSSSSS